MSIKSKPLFLVSIWTSIVLTVLAMSELWSIPTVFYRFVLYGYLTIGFVALITMWQETLSVGSAEDYIRAVIKTFLLVFVLGLNALVIVLVKGIN